MCRTSLELSAGEILSLSLCGGGETCGGLYVQVLSSLPASSLDVLSEDCSMCDGSSKISMS